MGNEVFRQHNAHDVVQSADSQPLDVGQLRLLFDAWPHAAFAINAAGAFVYQNEIDRAAFGDLIGKTAADLTDDNAKAENWTSVHQRVLGGETVTMLLKNEAQNPNARDADVTLAPIWSNGVPIGIIGMTVNRTEAWRLQREMEVAAQDAKASQARLKRLTDSVPGAIFEFVLDDEGRSWFPYINSGMGPLLGTSTEAILNDPEEAFRHDHPDDAEIVQQAIEQSFVTLEPVSFTHRLIHPELGLRWNRIEATASARPQGGVVWHGCIFDVTEEHARAQELETARNRMAALSLFDTLTGLPNRRACEEEYARRKADQAARDARATVIRIDLDHFKSVNDTLGHEAGDAVLCRVSDCLRQIMGPHDFSARLGGDEFVILLAPGKTLDCAHTKVQHLRETIAEPFTHDGRHCSFGASFGIATTETLPTSFALLLSPADAALLQAKDRGRGRISVFTPELQRRISHSRMRATQIRLALERSEFVPFFQPQVDAQTGGLSGFEVLARWRHPTEGCLAPDEFIPVAEQIRVVQDIDRMMFEKALRVLRDLQDNGFSIPKLSFNVSAARVHEPEIIQSVRGLQTRGTRVAFELLESILLEDETALFAHHIDRLKEMGVEIEVDDFGSGRASVIGVLKVAPTALKLDRQLVLPMFESDMAKDLLKAMVDIGRSLNVRVTAEGVETLDHARALRALGCDTLQGYAFGRPMPEADLKEYLSGFAPALRTGQG